MTVMKHIVCLVVLTLQWTLTGATEVSCVFMERCTLPCSFEIGTDVVIHWHQVKAGQLLVHSFYHNKDQLTNQDQFFRNRTSLFKDQISRGNASLQLTEVKAEDEGRYKCYTSTIRGNKESFINLKLDAPVHEVNIKQEANRISCSSEGIYPKPELTWSTSPPSSITSNNTAVQQSGQQLYSISSSLTLSATDTDLVFSCTVSTRRNRKTATLYKPTSQDGLEHETTISCNSLNTPFSDLVWRFNHSQILLTKTGTDTIVSEEWRKHVKEVSESGSLTLQDLSSAQDGIYTCELSDAGGMKIFSSFVRISKGNQNNNGAIIGGVVAAILVVAATAAAVGLVVRNRHRTNEQHQCANDNNRDSNNGTELPPIRSTNSTKNDQTGNNQSDSPLLSNTGSNQDLGNTPENAGISGNR